MKIDIANKSDSPDSKELLDERSDKELVDLAQDGDQSAFRTLVERYESTVAATVIGMLGPGAEADDVGQETFIRLYRSLHKFRGEAKLGTYLTRIAINLSLDALRRLKKNRLRFWSWEGEETLPNELVVQGDQHIEATGRREIVQRAVRSLDPRHRAVVVLRMLNGYSTKETGALLGIPTGTVLSRLSRAQDKLKKMLKPFIDDFEV